MIPTAYEPGVPAKGTCESACGNQEVQATCDLRQSAEAEIDLQESNREEVRALGTAYGCPERVRQKMEGVGRENV